MPVSVSVLQIAAEAESEAVVTEAAKTAPCEPETAAVVEVGYRLAPAVAGSATSC